LIPLIDGIIVSDTSELHHAPTKLIETNVGDYPPIRNFDDIKYVCYSETTKLWVIAGPIAFNIWCNYGINSFTNIFVGHIGNVELSAVAISLSVIANFLFGFVVKMLVHLLHCSLWFVVIFFLLTLMTIVIRSHWV